MLRVAPRFIPAFIMVVVISVLTGLALVLFYQEHIQHEKEALVAMVKGQAQLIESVTDFDAQYSQDDHSEGARVHRVAEGNIQHAGRICF